MEPKELETSNAPDISVVVAGNDAATPIGVCLQSLANQQDTCLEIIVAVGQSSGMAEEARRVSPQAKVIELGQPATLARLRGLAIKEAKGDVIAVLDPYSVVAPDWAAMVVRSHRENANGAIGGAVSLYQQETSSLWNWSRYLNEYGLFMPPVPAGSWHTLPGCNISYKRDAVPMGDEFWKTFVNESLRGGRDSLLIDPRIRISLYKPISTWSYFVTRFDHGRCYAGMRSVTPLARMVLALASPAIPFLLYWRLLRAYWPRGRHRFKLLLTTPLQFLYNANWMLGEFVGYLFGSGRSCSRLYY